MTDDGTVFTPSSTKIMLPKARVNHIHHKAFLAADNSYVYVPPKVKRRSILSSQWDIETLFNNLD
jgi:hypothetical protein